MFGFSGVQNPTEKQYVRSVLPNDCIYMSNTLLSLYIDCLSQLSKCDLRHWMFVFLASKI